VVKLSYQSIHKRYSTWINILWNQVIDKICQQDTELFSKCEDAKWKNIMAAKKILSMFRVHGSLTVLNLIVFYSVLFYEHIKTLKALLSKAVLLISCKNGQKFELKCALIMTSWYDTNS
jgi:hypothetical protein